MSYTYGSESNCTLKNGTTNNKYVCRLGWELVSQNIANNTSTINLRLEVKSTNSSYGTYGYNQTTTIDGTALSAASFDMRNTNVWQTFGTRQITVSHSSTGSYSTNKSGSFSTTATSTYSLKSGSCNVTVNPPNIPRYATVNQSLSSKTSSSITMRWSSDSTIDYIWYSKDSGSNWTGIDIADSSSGSYTISNLNSNTAYNIKTRVRRKDSQLTTDSSALNVTTYATTIPTISLSSKTINSITVSSSCNISVSSTQYRIKVSGGSYGSYQNSATFSSLSANTAYVIEVKKIASESGESGTATLNVTTYDYAKISSFPGFNLGSSETLGYSNPSGSIIEVALYLTDGSTVLASYRNASGSSYTFNFTDAELDNIYKRLGNNNSISIRAYIKTICNGTNYYHYSQATVTLTGNQKTGHINISNAWKRGKYWLNISGTYKKAIMWENINGTWKRGI